ncbi:putative N-acetyl-LL-diaminopimelate aminotransferase [Botrimarina colliarenosi]|uniref:Aminotransferase n=1 Tax=Botrimarina colliarenosi TaxID=2528001 RepID=A0A5C6AK83_9BACT|nr:aminotransferase class I/II-fold pyridoxal phosphate-dependent enzyme [Botrimarina colliarenosi]TWT99658.1 putative N-acetyl-LL-diaminopimelate aminotransferase [Botrimarina colliarenosi]
MPAHPWLADRTDRFDSSGIRKVFDLAAKLKDPINLSIGQPDFPAPPALKEAACKAIHDDLNGYSPTQGAAALRDRLQARVDEEWGHEGRKLLVTSGTSGALNLAMWALVNPGDEVIVFDPYFVMYPTLCEMVGGVPVVIDTYEDDFQINLAKVEAAITPKTKLILFNSPANPTGVVASAESTRGLAELAKKHNIALLSDEIYREFCYDGALPSPARWNDQTIVVDGFSKSYGVTGWRIGWIHGPSALIDKMAALQQYTFVCAPHPLQHAAIEAFHTDMSAQVDAYRERRDHVVAGLRDAGYEVAPTGGAFYVFPKAPAGQGSASEFVARAIEHELLVIPGGIFSRRDTHFRISYAAPMATLDRGLEVLRRLAKR